MKIKIRAIEKYMPGELISSSSLEKEVGLKAGWTAKNTGVEARYRAGKDETIATMGAEALSETLKKSGLSLADLDMLLYAGGSYDYPIPYNACLIKNELSKN